MTIVTPWLDTRPGVSERERLKAFCSEAVSGEKHTAFSDPRGPKRLVMFASADGFTFRKLDPQPDIVSKLPNSFDGGNAMANASHLGVRLTNMSHREGE